MNILKLLSGADLQYTFIKNTLKYLKHFQTTHGCHHWGFKCSYYFCLRLFEHYLEDNYCNITFNFVREMS